MFCDSLSLTLLVVMQVPLDWVQAMLERGANMSINDEDNEGRSALDRCEKGSPSKMVPDRYCVVRLSPDYDLFAEAFFTEHLIQTFMIVLPVLVFFSLTPLFSVYELLIKYGAKPRPEKPPTPPPEAVKPSRAPAADKQEPVSNKFLISKHSVS